jgi:hypothetical protein
MTEDELDDDVCCCGDSMSKHQNPYDAGHMPVSQKAYYLSQQKQAAPPASDAEEPSASDKEPSPRAKEFLDSFTKSVNDAVSEHVAAGRIVSSDKEAAEKYSTAPCGNVSIFLSDAFLAGCAHKEAELRPLLEAANKELEDRVLLKRENVSLRERLRKAIEGIRFLGDHDNWKDRLAPIKEQAELLMAEGSRVMDMPKRVWRVEINIFNPEMRSVAYHEKELLGGTPYILESTVEEERQRARESARVELFESWIKQRKELRLCDDEIFKWAESRYAFEKDKLAARGRVDG